MDNLFPSINISNIYDYQEYYLINEKSVYKLLIGNLKNSIFIKCKHYYKIFGLKEISNLFQISFNSLSESYQKLKNLFEEEKIIIKNILPYKEMKLILNIYKEEVFELTLNYNSNNKNNIIFNGIKELKNEINDLKISNEKLRKEIKELKEYHQIKAPKDIKLLSNAINDSFVYSNLDYSFTVFNSINNILYLIYSNENKSMICYDLNNQRKINEIKNIHDEFITNFRHYLDEINKRDLVMSLSRNDNNIKIWNINNFECILDIKNVNQNGYIYSACFLKDNSQNYIIASNRNMEGEPSPIKIFNFKGQKIDEIKDSKDHTFFIDTFYDTILNKNFIITGNFGYVKSFDYSKNELYHKYDDNKCDNNDRFHCSIIIKNNERKIKLIESSGDGFIRIWNFHSGLLLNKIQVGSRLYSICLWNKNYLFVGCQDNTIKLIELNNKLIVKSLYGHDNWVLTLKKVCDNKGKELLISQNWGISSIKIWFVED